MTNKGPYWLAAVGTVAIGLVQFVSKILSGRSAGDAAIGAAIYMVIIGVVFLFLVRQRRKIVRSLKAKGQVECYIRRLPDPARGHKGKWEIGLVTVAPEVLTFQPVLGRTSIARGNSFDIRVLAVAGPRFQPTKWDKFNRLEPKALGLPLETDQGPLELAGQANVLDKIESLLAGAGQR